MAVLFKSENRSFVNKTDLFGAAVGDIASPIKKVPVPGAEESIQSSSDNHVFVPDNTAQETAFSSRITSPSSLSHDSVIEQGSNQSPSSVRFEQGKYGKEYNDTVYSHGTDRGTGRTSDPYIYFREQSESSNPALEKVAKSSDQVKAGDGGAFTFEFDKKGNLKGKLSLAKGLDRTSNKSVTGILGIGAKGGEKVHDAYEIFKPESDKPIDEYFDDKSETFLDHIVRDTGRKRRRIKAIRLNANKEIKQLKKEIKRDAKAEESTIIDSYFNKSDTSFASDEAKFSQFVDERFDRTHEKVDVLFEKDPDSRAAVSASIKKDSAVESKFEKDSVTSVNHYDTSEPKGSNSLFIEQNKEAAQHRQMNKQDQLAQKKVEKKTAKKQENKQLRRQAAATALIRTIETKKNFIREWGDVNGQNLTGDLLADGNSGLNRAFTESLKNGAKRVLSTVSEEIGKLLLKFLKYFLGLIAPYVPYAVLAILFSNVFFMILSGFLSIFGAEVENQTESSVSSYEINVVGSGTFHGDPYSAEEIENIINQLQGSYSNFSAEQEATIRYALSAVGSSYGQDPYHWNHEDNIYDCSELAYLACLAGGVDISNNGYYSAAEECRAMDNGNYSLQGEFTFQPGDIIFYGGANNERYNGVYHVAIYLGNIDGADKMVEAYGSDRGVIVSDVRESNVVNVSRVFLN